MEEFQWLKWPISVTESRQHNFIDHMHQPYFSSLVTTCLPRVILSIYPCANIGQKSQVSECSHCTMWYKRSKTIQGKTLHWACQWVWQYRRIALYSWVEFQQLGGSRNEVQLCGSFLTYIQSHLCGALRRQYTSNQRRWRQSLGGQLFGEVISFY